MKGRILLLGLVILGMITLLPGQPIKARPAINQEVLLQDESDPASIINNLETLYRNLTDRVFNPGWVHYAYEIKVNTDEADNGKLDSFPVKSFFPKHFTKRSNPMPINELHNTLRRNDCPTEFSSGI